ncbi:hypothetical protein IU479_36185, partial [Nocardia abscessus]|nr:hypothetical protein [Nocardia abscessus]
VGTLNTLRAQALESALAELLYSTPPEVDEDPEPSQTERDLLVMQQEERAVDQRLEMAPAARRRSSGIAGIRIWSRK